MRATKITKKRVADHFAYSVWKYALLIVLAAFGWNLIYSVTVYKPPADKKLDIYMVTYAMAGDAIDRLDQMASPAFPDLEAINFLHIAMNDMDDYYANIQLSTYIGAREGDVYLMPGERFRAYASGGLFAPLGDAIADGTIRLGEIDAQSGMMELTDDETGERLPAAIYGIPASRLYGLLELGIDNRDLWIGVTMYSQNIPNALKMVDWLIDSFTEEKPDWLTELEAAQPGVREADDPLPSY